MDFNKEFVILNILFPFNEGVELLHSDHTNLAMVTTGDDSRICVYLGENDEIRLCHLNGEVEESLLKLTAQHILEHKWLMLAEINTKRDYACVISNDNNAEVMVDEKENKDNMVGLVELSHYHPIYSPILRIFN